MPKYSIVTPSYNSFNLMDRYFESLESQTYKDFEVIIVDDCSTDGSFEKTKEYADSSSLKITVLQTERNAGPGNARNIGMDAATGAWLTFVDNDDWVDMTLFEKVDDILKSCPVDCVIYDYWIQKEREKSISRSMYFGERGIVSLSNCMIYARNHTVGKFYKLTSCRKANIRFPDVRRCEDVAFVCRAIDACGSVYYLNEPLYHYCQRSSSLSNNTKLDETDMIKAFGILEDTLGEKYSNELKEKSVCDLLYGVLLMMCKSGRKNGEIDAYIKKYVEKHPGWQKYQIINHLGKSKELFLKAAQMKAIPALKALAWAHSKMVG